MEKWNCWIQKLIRKYINGSIEINEYAIIQTDVDKPIGDILTPWYNFIDSPFIYIIKQVSQTPPDATWTHQWWIQGHTIFWVFDLYPHLGDPDHPGVISPRPYALQYIPPLLVFLVVPLPCNPLIPRRVNTRYRDCPAKLLQKTSVGWGALHPLPPPTPSVLLCELKNRNTFWKRETDLETGVNTWITK